MTTDFVGETDQARAIKVLADRRILVAGTVKVGGVNHFGLARYLPDGALDTTFGIAGKATLLIGSECEVADMAVQTDGMILVAGSAKVSNWHFALARFTASGEMDPTFDNDGIVTKAVSTKITSGNFATSLAIQSTGRIIVGGILDDTYDGTSFILLGYRPTGSIDALFGDAGVVRTPLSQGKSASIALQPDGGILHCGSGGVNASSNIVVLRYHYWGSLDTDFGSNGKVTIDFHGNVDVAKAVDVVPATGDIVVTGQAYDGTAFKAAVARIKSDGILDPAFGGNGKVTIGLPGFAVGGVDLIAQDDGHLIAQDDGHLIAQDGGHLIVCGGRRTSTTSEIVAFQLNSDGTLDTGFGSGGMTIASVDGSDYDAVSQFASQKGADPNRILAAGSSRISGQFDFSVVSIEQQASPPVVTYPTVSGVTAGGATVSFSVNPLGSETNVWIEYGLTTAFGSQTAVPMSDSVGTELQEVAGRITGLEPDTDYWVRVVAQNAGGAVATANQSLHTLKRPVVFIPGIAGSVIKYRLGGDGAWAGLWPSVDSIAISLLNPNGGVSNAQAVDVVRFFLVDFYGNFIDKWTGDLGHTEYLLEDDPTRLTSDHMLHLPLHERPTFFVFPYDWRLANQVHGATLHAYLGNISQLHDGVRPNLLAHSMGGLLVRRYMLDFSATYINKLVTVGSPFWGAPRTVYTMFSGAFYPFEGFDVINSGAMRRLAANSPGAHQLLPSDLLERHRTDFNPPEAFPPFVIEQRIDFNRNSTIDDGRNSAHSYSLSQVLDKIDVWTDRWRIGSSMPRPSVESDLFHSEHGGQQDDWSSDLSGVEFLHIAGQLESNDTTSTIVVEPLVGPGGTLGNQTPRFSEIRKKALGDGTVPLVSAIRRPEHLAPNSQVRIVIGPKSSLVHPERKASHNALMQNATVTQMITAFFANDPVPFGPTPLPAPAAMANETAGITVTHQEIFILGAGYVTMIDGDGNTNTLLSEIAAQQVPGVEADYGGDDLWCRLVVEPEVALTLSGASPSDVVEILVSQIGSDGSTLSTRRFLIEPAAMQWQFTLPAVDLANPTEPEMLVDANGDEDFTPDEQVAPTHSADGPNVDVTPPQLTLSLSASGPGIVSTLSPQDNQAGVKAFYTFNGGPVVEYSVPLDFAEGTEGILRAFAEDAMGNRSGLITTTVRPSVQIRNSGSSTVTLDWPVAEGYVLEQADTPAGPWTRSDADISKETFIESAEISVPPNSRGFYRLRTQSVTR